jgi:hypothetical protein
VAAAAALLRGATTGVLASGGTSGASHDGGASSNANEMDPSTGASSGGSGATGDGGALERDPEIASIVSGISADRIASSIQTLVAFGRTTGRTRRC